MPTLYHRIEATGVNILKTVTEEIVNGLINEFSLNEIMANSIYIGSSFLSYSDYDDNQGSPTLNKNRCDVNVEYILDQTQVPWPMTTVYSTSAMGMRPYRKGTYTPVFFDSDAGILAEHMTSPTAINMNFTLTFQAFNDAVKTFDTIKNRYSGSLVQNPFDLVFSYPVSMEVLKYLVSVFEAKKSYSDNPSKTILDYIKDIQYSKIDFDVRRSQIAKPDADVEMMIRCQQLGSVGQLTMEQKEPDVQKQGNLPASYSIQFDYVIQFGRPILLMIHTPISVENNVLPKSLFLNNTVNHHFNPYVSGVYQNMLCHEYLRRSAGDFHNISPLIRLPEYDDWLVVDQLYVEYKYNPLIIAHFTLDGDTTTFNIKTLDDIALHPIVIDIISQTGNSIFEYGGLFHIGVYADDLRLGSSILNLDSDLNLTITSNVPNKQYHLVISETTDLRKTDPKWDDILIKYRYFFPMTIERNINYLVDKNYFYIDYNNTLLNLINKLAAERTLKPILEDMMSLGECGTEIYGYSQNASQMADYMAMTKSLRIGYTLPTGNTAAELRVIQFYTDYTSVEGRSLLVAFLERCVKNDYIAISDLPKQYLQTNAKIFPYITGSGGFYGFNTPFRVANFVFGT